MARGLCGGMPRSRPSGEMPPISQDRQSDLSPMIRPRPVRTGLDSRCASRINERPRGPPASYRTSSDDSEPGRGPADGARDRRIRWHRARSGGGPGGRGPDGGHRRRDAGRGEAARRAIAAASGNERVELFIGDLSDLASVRRLATTLAEAHRAIDVLVHCAAVYTSHRAVTADGLERMFATNLVGPFLLTDLILDQLRAGRARILVLSAPSTVKLDFDDLQAERRFRSLSAFGASKAADLLFTFEARPPARG